MEGSELIGTERWTSEVPFGGVDYSRLGQPSPESRDGPLMSCRIFGGHVCPILFSPPAASGRGGTVLVYIGNRRSVVIKTIFCPFFSVWWAEDRICPRDPIIQLNIHILSKSLFVFARYTHQVAAVAAS